MTQFSRISQRKLLITTPYFVWLKLLWRQHTWELIIHFLCALSLCIDQYFRLAKSSPKLSETFGCTSKNKQQNLQLSDVSTTLRCKKIDPKRDLSSVMVRCGISHDAPTKLMVVCGGIMTTGKTFRKSSWSRLGTHNVLGSSTTMNEVGIIPSCKKVLWIWSLFSRSVRRHDIQRH